MAGIPYDGSTDANGNPVLPGVTTPGTGATGDNVTKDDKIYTSSAGDWGSLGAQVGGYSGLTEGYVRGILGASVATSDAWTNAWNGLCDLIAQFPFIRDILAFGGNVQNGLMQFLGGIQNLADAACAMLLGEQTYTANVTSVSATSTRITFTIATAANHQLPESVDTNTAFTVSGLSNDKYNGAFKVISVTRGSTQSTVVCASTAGVLSATAMSGTFTVRTTPTSLLGGIAAIVANILSLFGVDKLPAILTQVQDWINCIGGAVGSALDGTVHTIANIFTAIGDLVRTVLGWFGLGDGHVFKDIFDAVQNVVNCVGGAVGAVGTQVGSVVFHTITGIQTAFSNLLGAILTPFANGTVLSDVVGFVTSLIGLLGNNIGNAVSQFIQWFHDAINWIWNAFSFFLGGPTNQTGKTIMDIITLFTDWIWRMSSGLLGGVGTLIQNIVAAITGFGIDFLGDPLKTLGEFFSGLSNGANTLLHNILEGVAGALGQTVSTLYSWATNLVSIFNIPTILQNLWGWFIAHIPVANIGASTTPVNMLTLGTFETAATLQADSGWSWDSSNDRGGVVGGAAKLDCSVGAGWRFLFSNQNVTVAPGDKISASAYIKTGLDRNGIGFTGSNSSIVLLVIPFVKSTAQNPVVVATRGGSSGWVQFNGDTTAYTISQTNNPLTQVTSIKMCLAAAPSATSGSIWWDDIQMYKTGFMQQGLVEALPQAFGGLIDGLSGSPAGTTSTAYGTSTNMFLAATNPAGAAAVANTAAGAAKDNVQRTVNAIAKTVGGQSVSGDVSISEASVTNHFSNFFGKLYGNGATQPQNTVPQGSINNLPSTFGGMLDAFNKQPYGTNGSVSGTGSTFYTSVTAPLGLVGAAASQASSATENVTKMADGIAQTVGGNPGATNTNPNTIATSFGSFFTKLYGNGNTTPQNTVPQGSISNLPGAFGGMLDAFNKQAFGTNGNVTGTGSNLYTSVTATTGLVGSAVTNAGNAITAASDADTLATMVASSNNLILSPDFEESTIRRLAANAGLSFTVSYSTEQKRSGTQSLKLYANNAINSNSTGQWGGVTLSPVKSNNAQTYFMVAPGQVYSYDIYVYGAFTGSGQSAAVYFQLYDYNGSNVSYGNAATTLVKNTWVRIKGTITIPNTISSGLEPISMLPGLAIYGNPVNAGDSYYIDRAIIYR